MGPANRLGMFALLAAGCAPGGEPGAIDAGRTDRAEQPSATKATASRASPELTDAGGSDGATAACDQTLLGYPLPTARAHVLSPVRPVAPFYQWENNDGYCGEVSLMQAGLANGQWMSQYNARLVCGASYDEPDGGRVPALQSGPDGFCAAHGRPYELAQLLFTCSDGCAAARVCLENAGLDAEIYATPTGMTGMAAYRDFLSWVKERSILGYWVTVGVLWHYGHDDEYDHIVSVTGIGTNHDPTDSTYYADDVLSWDDHGLYTFEAGRLVNNPAIPHGAGTDVKGCTPYVFADTFDDLSRGRADMVDGGAQPYAFAMPRKGVKDFAFAVKGPLDGDAETLPVALRVLSTMTGASSNPEDPRAGYDYENPFVGTREDGTSCTNTPPASWMTVSAEATVSGLTPGVAYNLYEYRFDGVTGMGHAAALAVPTSAFNAHAAMATRTTSFVAGATTYTQDLTFTSDKVVVLRAVPASAP